MYMRRFLIILSGLLISTMSLSSQPKQRVYIFPEFSVGHIVLFNGTETDALLNFDAAGQTINYYEGSTLMEMTNLPMIKTLQVGDRVFVVKEGLLCEVIDNASGPILVNWKFKNNNRGSTGALGATTQAKVEAYRPFNSDYLLMKSGNHEELDWFSVEVWETINENTYFISAGGAQHKIKKLKDLCAAFPSQAKALKSYARTHHLMMNKAEDAFKIFDYLHVLLAE